MSPDVPPPVSAAAATATTWSADVARLLGSDAETGFRVTRGVLHVLHEVLDGADSAALSADLPTVLRGTYHEPAPGHPGVRTREGFVDAVRRSTRQAVRPEEAARAVCAVLRRRLPPGTWAVVEAGLPAAVRPLVSLPPRLLP